jgi:hypothetical protein
MCIAFLGGGGIFSPELSGAVAGMSLASLIDLNEFDHENRHDWTDKAKLFFRISVSLICISLSFCVLDTAKHLWCGKSLFEYVGWWLVPLSLLPSAAGELFIAVFHKKL